MEAVTPRPGPGGYLHSSMGGTSSSGEPAQRPVRAAANAHPFRCFDASTQGEAGGFFITMKPGTVAAMGGGSEIPTWYTGGASIDLVPLVAKEVPYADTWLLIDVEYNADEEWQSTKLRFEDATTFDMTSTYLHGYKLVARLQQVTTEGVRSIQITQAVGSNLSHGKCNIYHTWEAV